MPREIRRVLSDGETRILEGMVVLFDWDLSRRHEGEGSARCELVQRDDGSAYVDLFRYTKTARHFSDRRRIPIEGETFLALADALFSPVEVDDRLRRLREAAVASGRYATCRRCQGSGWAKCQLCHGKGIAPIDRVQDWIALRASASAAPSAPPVDEAATAPTGMFRLSPRPRQRYPRITMDGGACLTVRRGKGRGFTYGPKLSIRVEKGLVCAMVGDGQRPVMSDHPAVVAFFESFDEALRRDKSRQVREQSVKPQG